MAPDDVLAEAREIDDFVPFLSLFGASVKSGRSADVLAALSTTAGFDSFLVWELIESWANLEEDEIRTGWTALVSTAASLLEADPNRCYNTDWNELVHKLAFAPAASM